LATVEVFRARCCGCDSLCSDCCCCCRTSCSESKASWTRRDVETAMRWARESSRAATCQALLGRAGREEAFGVQLLRPPVGSRDQLCWEDCLKVLEVDMASHRCRAARRRGAETRRSFLLRPTAPVPLQSVASTSFCESKWKKFSTNFQVNHVENCFPHQHSQRLSNSSIFIL
jgi:hypothetical protein